MQQLHTDHLQLQVPEYHWVTAVDISFMPTLAFFIQQSFNVKEVWQEVQSADHIQLMWQTAAEVCGAQASIAQSLADTSFLQALLAADPLQTILSDQLLYGKTAATMLPQVLPQVEPPIQLLLLFAQLLVIITAEHKNIIGKIPVPLHSEEGSKLLRSAITIKLQELTQLSSCHTIMLPDIGGEAQLHHDALVPPAEPSKTSLLRSTVLTTKLAMLTFNFQADIEDLSRVLSLHALGSVMDSLYSSMTDMPAEITEAQPKPTHSSYDGKGNEEVKQLCLALCQALVPALRHCSRDPVSKTLSLPFLRLLTLTLRHIDTEEWTLQLTALGKVPQPGLKLILNSIHVSPFSARHVCISSLQ